MAWTPEDIAAVRAAIVEFAIGKRVVSLTFAGPPQRQVQYTGPQGLSELRSLLAEMTSQSAPRYRHVTFAKGFDRG